MLGALAMIASSVIGGGASMYAANQANQGGIDPAYAAAQSQMMEHDLEMTQDMRDLWEFNEINPYGDRPRPYTSNTQQGQGHYIDAKSGKIITQEEYNRRTKGGQKNIKQFEKNTTWIPFAPAAAPSTEGSQYHLAQRKLETQHEMYGDLVDFANDYLKLQADTMAQESQALEGRYAAEAAENQFTIDTMPKKGEADIAKSQYEIDTMPVKSATEIAAMQEKQRLIDLRAPVMSEYFGKVMEGVDPKASMDSATAEVMQANDATKAGMRRDAMSMGVLPGSARYEAMMRDDRNQTVGAIADARTAAKNKAEETSFNRLSGAMGVGGGA